MGGVLCGMVGANAELRRRGSGHRHKSVGGLGGEGECIKNRGRTEVDARTIGVTFLPSLSERLNCQRARWWSIR